MNETKMRELIKQVERRKRAIAKHRDALRDIVMEMEDLLGSVERGVDGLESGIAELEGAVDSLSEYL